MSEFLGKHKDRYRKRLTCTIHIIFSNKDAIF